MRVKKDGGGTLQYTDAPLDEWEEGDIEMQFDRVQKDTTKELLRDFRWFLTLQVICSAIVVIILESIRIFIHPSFLIEFFENSWPSIEIFAFIIVVCGSCFVLLTNPMMKL